MTTWARDQESEDPRRHFWKRVHIQEVNQLQQAQSLRQQVDATGSNALLIMANDGALAPADRALPGVASGWVFLRQTPKSKLLPTGRTSPEYLIL